MSNTKYHNIEYFKSELTKKDEIIEKLFEEIDDLKDKQEELKKINYNLKIENEDLKNPKLKKNSKKQDDPIKFDKDSSFFKTLKNLNFESAQDQKER